MSDGKPKFGFYQHYKGQKYKLLHIARHSETEEELAIYQTCYGDYGIWARPLKMFLEKITIEGQEQDRFRFIGESDIDN